MTRLTVIDEETRTELAELGMTTRVQRVLCRDCRFLEKTTACLVNGGGYTWNHNPIGECEKFELRPPAHFPVRTVMLVAFSSVLGFLLGLAVSL